MEGLRPGVRVAPSEAAERCTAAVDRSGLALGALSLLLSTLLTVATFLPVVLFAR
jgi:hypothetical protein